MFHLQVTGRCRSVHKRWYFKLRNGTLAWMEDLDICAVMGIFLRLQDQKNPQNRLLHVGTEASASSVLEIGTAEKKILLGVTHWTTSGSVPRWEMTSDTIAGRTTSEVVLSRMVSGFVRDGANSEIVRDRLSSVLGTGRMASVLARCRGVNSTGPLGRSQKLRTERRRDLNFWGKLYTPDSTVVITVVLNRPLQSPHNLFHSRSFLGILLPAALNELPHFTSKPYCLSVSRHLRSVSSCDAKHRCFVLLSFERHLTGEYFYR